MLGSIRQELGLNLEIALALSAKPFGSFRESGPRSFVNVLFWLARKVVSIEAPGNEVLGRLVSDERQLAGPKFLDELVAIFSLR